MKTLKSLLYAVWGLITVAAICWGIISARRLSNSNTKADAKSARIQTEATIIAREIDKEGIEHVTARLTNKAIPRERLNDIAISEGILDTAKLYIESLKGRLNSAMAVNSRLVIQNQQLTRIARAVGSETDQYKYQDKNAGIIVNIPRDTLIIPTFTMTYDANLVVSQYSKRKSIFGKRQEFFDVYSTDPRMTINGLKTLSVEDKPSLFSLKLQAVADYNIGTQRVGLGPGVRLGVGRFSFQGNHLYYPETSKWFSIIGGSYDIIRF